jgi:hypothetical protein
MRWVCSLQPIGKQLPPEELFKCTDLAELRDALVFAALQPEPKRTDIIAGLLRYNARLNSRPC